MKITYLGTGAAEGIPALFCNCAYCRSAKARGEIRSRSQVLIDNLSIDFPPDAFYHAARFGVDFSAIEYLLISHSHMDHFYAHDFILRGYKYAREMKSKTLHIYGNEEVLSVFEESTAREMRAEVGETISLHKISAFEKVAFGDFTVHTLKAQHSSSEPLLFLIEKDGKKILHLYDTGKLPEEDYAYLQKIGCGEVDLINLDCTFLWGTTEEHARHMGVDENLRTLARLEQIGLVGKNTKKVLTHFSHNSAPTKENLTRAEQTLGAIAAYDGMTITL